MVPSRRVVQLSTDTVHNVTPDAAGERRVTKCTPPALPGAVLAHHRAAGQAREQQAPSRVSNPLARLGCELLPDDLRQHEAHVLAHDLKRLDGLRPAVAEELHEP